MSSGERCFPSFVRHNPGLIDLGYPVDSSTYYIWFSGVLEDDARGDRDLIIALATAIKTPFGLPCLHMAISRARKPFQPPQLKQKPEAGLLGSKPLHKFQDGSGTILKFHQCLYYI
jgi:hypothetical protein